MAQKMTVAQFVEKWGKIQLKEKSAAQSHFNDVCALVGHATPTEMDPNGSFFTFEAPTLPSPIFDEVQSKMGEGGRRPGGGWADAWYKGKFIWEYKGKGKNLDAAYQQLLRYREFLGNPPLLITSDLDKIIIHTNFNNTARRTEVIDLERLQKDGLQLLRDAFYNPDAFKPTETQEKITEKTANSFSAFADALKKHGKNTYQSERLAHFVARILFCLFAEDIGLLPNKVFSELVRRRYKDPNTAPFTKSLRQLFAAMREGNSVFGAEPIPWFNGGLFEDDFVPEVWGLHDLLSATDKDWAGIDPSIFGTLFERIIDDSKRAQLGAHYTSKNDILLVIDPVLMTPLRAKWRKVQTEVESALRQEKPFTAEHAESAENLKISANSAVSAVQIQAYTLLEAFSAELAALKVLDPACGSGNFLYLALRELLDLQKKVIVFAAEHGLPEIPLTVNPQQLLGIETNPYAHQLAQITVWIGYIQWRYENGFAEMQEPILRELEGIENRDAILNRPDRSPQELGQAETHVPASITPGKDTGGDLSGLVREPAWPPADVIIGNPPFLGGNKIRAELGDAYVDALFKLYAGRVPAFADLVCYWFEKARAQIESGQLQRAGLLATQAIRGGVNRKVLEKIKETGDIFWAQSDRKWILDGAMVHVSMVGFDDGTIHQKLLNNHPVADINPDLTENTNITRAFSLKENGNISFQGPSPKAPFDIDKNIAQKLLQQSNLNGQPNSDVVWPVVSAIDIGQRNRDKWTIYFDMLPLEQASQYQAPFEYVKTNILPIRKTRRNDYRGMWWQYGRPRPEMSKALFGTKRYIATPRVSKHRIFIWLDSRVLANDGTIVFAREDDYFFGVLHSKVHELWARRTGTQLREAESGFRYTPTTTFETYPFPWPPGSEPAQDPRVQAIAAAAKALDDFRNSWLHPKDSLLQGSKELQKRTLTNLYNCLTVYREKIKGKQRIESTWKTALRQLFHTEKLAVELILSLDEVETLDELHATLDQSALEAYGWPRSLSDEQILEKLLALNLERASK
jgi:hypothetical protein